MKIMKKILFIPLCILLGCSSTYTKEVPLDEQLGLTNEIRQSYNVNEEWWKSYNDPELNRLIALALENNIDLAQSSLNISKALYQMQLSELDLYPTLSSGLGISTSKQLSKGKDFDKTFSGEFAIKYEVDLYGKTRDLVSAKEWELKATILDKETARLALINSVIDVYYNLVYLNDSVISTKDNIKNYQKVGNIVDSKFEYGKTDAMEPLQIRQSIIAYQNRLVEFDTQIKNNEQLLRNLLNLKPTDQLKITYPDMLKVKTLGVDLNVPMAVLAERPDLKASEYRLQKAFKNLEAENKNWYPTVSLSTAISSSSNKFENTFDFPLAVGRMSVDLPFLQWNTVKTNIKISEADYESARLDFEGSINTALNEVAYYYQAYTNEQSLFKNIKIKHDADLKISQLYDLRFHNGKVEFRDFLDSINTANNSKLELLNEKYQLIKYENMLFKALAGKYEKIK